MSEESAFKPRLGRIGDLGSAGNRRVRSQILRAAARLRKGAAKPGFTGARIGRGRAVRFAQTALPRFRMRKVIVKVHIARAKGKTGNGAFRAHLNYLQRDGVEHDGRGGKLYDRDGDEVDKRGFLDRGNSDRHQFRIIVSPEDGHALADLKDNTRQLMTQMEADLGVPLDWVAADHHNTGYPHTHVVIRGKDPRGRDLVIARNYLTKGLRNRAEEIATRTLGPKRDLEIMASRQSDVTKDRFTRLDRSLEESEHSGVIEISNRKGSAQRFERALAHRRLKHLQTLNLAHPITPGRWQMRDGWANTLKALGRKGDVIRSLSAEHSARLERETLKFWSDRKETDAPLIGEVMASGPDDELRDRRFLIVRDFQGEHWHVQGGEEVGLPDGAIVEVRGSIREARPADHVIAQVADKTGGFYSADLHAAFDPSSTAAYREAHKRRLEALRRAGLLQRRADGQWDIPEGFLKRVAKFEQTRGHSKIRVRSWLSLTQQTKALGPTWLDDQIGTVSTSLQPFAEQRKQILLSRGDPARSAMRKEELMAAVQNHAANTGETYRALQQGDEFRGKFRKTLDLGQGRMALLSDGKEFVLVPWRREMMSFRGRNLAIERSRTGVSFSLARQRTRGLGL